MDAPKPVRPAITPVFGCACLFWATCAGAYSLSQGMGARSCFTIAMALGIACFLAVAAGAIARRPALGMVAASLLMGACLGSASAASIHVLAEEAGATGWQGAMLELSEDSRQTVSGESALARVTLPSGQAAIVNVDFGECDPLFKGQRVLVDARLSAADFADDDYLWQNGAVGRLRVTGQELCGYAFPLAPLLQMRSKAVYAIGSEDQPHALVQALACGYRHGVSGTPAYSCFQACGLAHLVAVSGAHLVIVTGLAASALNALRVPRRVTVGILVAVMVAYLVLAGIPVSAVRATVMSSVGVLSIVGRRRPSAQNALGLGVFAIAGTWPPASVSASFMLSALSTAGIVLFGPLVRYWLHRTPLRGLPFAEEALGLTLSANALSQLYACALFHQLPIVGPIANVVCAPLFPLVCGSGLFAGVFGGIGFPGAGVAVFAAAVLSSALDVVVGLLAKLPYASVPFSLDVATALFASIMLAATLWVTWPSPSIKMAAACLAGAIAAVAALALPLLFEDSLTMLDVGQGDAFLVRSHGQTLLVDTGNRDGQLLQQLAECGVLHLDSVLLTHADDDHVGSLDALERAVTVDRALMAAGLPENSDEKAQALVQQARRTARDVVELGYDDSFVVGAFTAKVIWPHEVEDAGGNADSVCLLLQYDGDADGLVDFTAFMTGDAEQQQVASMVSDGSLSHVDVLKVGHHGSKSGLDDEQAALLHPTVALISVGAGNRYGHPADETLELLNSVGSRIYRTDEDGRVKCMFKPDSLAVVLQ